MNDDYATEKVDDNESSSKGTEETEFKNKISRLIELCDKRPPLDPGERQERDDLLAYLRKKGYTSSEISKMISQKLQEDTIRKLVSRVKPGESAIKNRVAELIGDAIRADVWIEDIRRAISVKNDLAEDVSLEEVSLFLGEVHKSRDIVGGVKGVLSMYRAMKEQGLTLAKVNEFLAYQQEIRSAGIQTQHLQKISQVARKY
jgi:DNA-binding transcriptional MerR regulator